MKIKELNNKPVWLAIIIYAASFSCLSILKYQNFIYNDFDLAIDAQTLWNITHGSLYSSIHQVVFLGNHMRLILFLLAPFYAIFKSPVFLLILQSGALGLAAYPLYKIAKGLLNPAIALAISVSYLLYPALGYMNLFEFHPTALATCFLMFMLYYFYENKFLGFCVFALLALLCQENISLLLITMGIFALFIKKDKKWAILPIMAGITYFYIAVFKIMPYFSKGTIALSALYSNLGSNLGEAFLTVSLNPAYVFSLLIVPGNLYFLFQLFMPLMFLPFLCLPLLAVSGPIFMQHLLSTRVMEQSILYHYCAELIPFIFVSAVYGAKRLFEILDKPVERRAVLCGLLSVAVISSAHLGALSNISDKLNAWGLAEDISRIRQGFIARIPQDASVAATFVFLPKLSNRRHLYSFHHFYKGFFTMSSKKYRLPETIDYALIDFSDTHTFRDFYSKEGVKNIKDFLKQYNLGVLDFVNEIALYKKGIADNISLYEVLDKQLKPQHILSMKIDKNIVLEGYDIEEVSADIVQVTFYWRCVKNTGIDYTGLIYSDDDKYSFCVSNFMIGSRLYPASVWSADKLVKDTHRFVLPKSKYYQKDGGGLLLVLVNSKSRKFAKIDPSNPEQLTERGHIKIPLK